jgi:hypothetical protein
MAGLNLLAFARVGAAILAPRGRSAPWAGIAAIKLLGLFGAFYFLLQHQIVTPFPLMIGYAALPVGITLGFLLSPRGDDDDDVG